nr:hypothetical protein [Sobelivirales sp.]
MIANLLFAIAGVVVAMCIQIASFAVAALSYASDLPLSKAIVSNIGYLEVAVEFVVLCIVFVYLGRALCRVAVTVAAAVYAGYRYVFPKCCHVEPIDEVEYVNSDSIISVTRVKKQWTSEAGWQTKLYSADGKQFIIAAECDENFLTGSVKPEKAIAGVQRYEIDQSRLLRSACAGAFTLASRGLDGKLTHIGMGCVARLRLRRDEDVFEQDEALLPTHVWNDVQAALSADRKIAVTCLATGKTALVGADAFEMAYSLLGVDITRWAFPINLKTRIALQTAKLASTSVARPRFILCDSGKTYISMADSVRPDMRTPYTYYHNASTRPGNSGAPGYDKNGRLSYIHLGAFRSAEQNCCFSVVRAYTPPRAVKKQLLQGMREPADIHPESGEDRDDDVDRELDSLSVHEYQSRFVGSFGDEYSADRPIFQGPAWADMDDSDADDDGVPDDQDVIARDAKHLRAAYLESKLQPESGKTDQSDLVGDIASKMETITNTMRNGRWDAAPQELIAEWQHFVPELIHKIRPIEQKIPLSIGADRYRRGSQLMAKWIPSTAERDQARRQVELLQSALARMCEVSSRRPPVVTLAADVPASAAAPAEAVERKPASAPAVVAAAVLQGRAGKARRRKAKGKVAAGRASPCPEQVPSGVVHAAIVPPDSVDGESAPRTPSLQDALKLTRPRIAVVNSQDFRVRA